MIVENGKYYLYRHIRDDINMPFYIGIGQKASNKGRRESVEYERAYVKGSRTAYWKSIIKGTSYRVEILMESDNKKFIESKEREFICMYGRKDNGTGILSNFTDGGDYYPVSNSHTANKISPERRKEIRKTFKMPVLGTNPVSVYVYDKTTGKFLKEYPQIKLAAQKLNVNKNLISSALKHRYSVRGYIFSQVFLGDRCNISNFIIRRTRCIAVLRIDPISLAVTKRYEKQKDAAKDLGIPLANFNVVISKGTKAKGFYWKYDDGLPFSSQHKRNRYQAVQKIDVKTNEVLSTYDTIKQAAELNGYKSSSSIKAFMDKEMEWKGIIWKRIKHV